MNRIFAMLLAAIAGGALGTFFFGGLWWTIQKGISSRQPALLFFVSLLVRMGAVLAGFYFVGLGNWQRLLACLFGFVIARVLVSRGTRPAPRTAHAS